MDCFGAVRGVGRTRVVVDDGIGALIWDWVLDACYTNFLGSIE